MSARIVAFLALSLALAAAGWWVLAERAPAPPPAPSGATRFVAGAEALDRIRSGPHLVFRNLEQREGYGRVALASLAAPHERYLTPLECERVYFAAGRGICLAADRGVLTTYRAHVFDASFARGPGVPLTGFPSRARVSPDGRHAGFTVFESGHSYAEAGFSTRTEILDARSGEPLTDLEAWPVTRDGKPFRAVDFNLWGVTFAADGKGLFATLASGGKTFLVAGNLAERTLRVLREGGECPSLSPDGRRLVFKRRDAEGESLAFRLHTLELETGAEASLDSEPFSVDDQAAWLDDHHVVYERPATRVPPTGGMDVFVMEARPGAAPRLLLEQAASPAVVR
jgi:WD40-like Beta Propeller Repeat